MAGIFVKLDQLRNGERPVGGGQTSRGLAEGKRAGPDGPTAPGVEQRRETRTSDKWTAVRIRGRISPDGHRPGCWLESQYQPGFDLF